MNVRYYTETDTSAHRVPGYCGLRDPGPRREHSRRHRRRGRHLRHHCRARIDASGDSPVLLRANRSLNDDGNPPTCRAGPMTDTREPLYPANRMHASEDDLADIQAALAVEARIARGEEELIPARIVDQLIDGEPPLRVWREFRDQSQAALARASGVNRDTNRRHRSRPQQWVRSTPSASWPTR